MSLQIFNSIINIVVGVVCDMSRNNIKKVRQYLDESFDSSDFSHQDDSNVDLDFSLPSTRQDSLPRAGSSHTFTNTGSDTSNESLEVSSSDSDNDDYNNANNNDNDDQWYKNWEDIPFQFDNSMLGIKLNIPDSAKDNLIQIFEMLWIHEITEMVVSSTKNYGVKLTSQNCPHKKHYRTVVQLSLKKLMRRK